MNGLESLNKFVNIFAEYCVKTQHQEMNATNMQTAVEYLARSEECRTIEKSLKALEIIKEKEVDIEYIKKESTTFEGFNRWIEFIDSIGINIPKNRNRQLTEEEFNILKEVLEC